jgi:hypothetical protein
MTQMIQTMTNPITMRQKPLTEAARFSAAVLMMMRPFVESSS